MVTGVRLSKQESTQSHHMYPDIVSNSVVMMMIISFRIEKEADSIVQTLGSDWRVSGCHIQ